MGHIAVDALVVGAGFGGIYATYRFAQMGMNVKCIDVADDVGGTWFWNRYPGAMSDTESYLYRYSWDNDDLKTSPWSSRYLYQPEILHYLQHVVKKHDLRKFMEFNVEMTAAKWNESALMWEIATSCGRIIRARYLVNCLGVLSKANFPDIPGIESFKGQLVHTAQWDATIQLKGKKVGVVGNGSTGVQVMTAIAPIVQSLKSYQRHPQYSVPSGQGPISPTERQKINENYEDIWRKVRSSAVGFGVPEVGRKTMDATPQQREEAFEKVWQEGNGFRFMFSAFGDIVSDETANLEACKFIRAKIQSIVEDPRKAAILTPQDLYARRPLCDTGYYQIFRQENVDVIDLKANPIVKIVDRGIELSDGTVHELDVLIFATGFDAIEGNYLRLKITGKHGETIQDHWKEGPTAYGGIACSGFPNMFLVSGPQAPFANFPPVIESEIDFIMSCISHAEGGTTRKEEGTFIEISKEAENLWSQACDRLVDGLLFKRTASWIFGANIPGRKPSTTFYFGGLGAYRGWTDEVASKGFVDFKISS